MIVEIIVCFCLNDKEPWMREENCKKPVADGRPAGERAFVQVRRIGTWWRTWKDECLLRALYLRMQWSKEVVYLGTWYNLESPWKEVSVMNCLHWIDYGQACEGFSQLGRLSEKMNPECELHPCNGWALDCMRSAQNTVCMHRSLLTVGTIRPILSKLLSLQCPCHDGLGPGTVHWINSYCIKLALVRVFCHSNRDEAETQIERWQLAVAPSKWLPSSAWVGGNMIS